MSPVIAERWRTANEQVPGFRKLARKLKVFRQLALPSKTGGGISHSLLLAVEIGPPAAAQGPAAPAQVWEDAAPAVVARWSGHWRQTLDGLQTRLEPNPYRTANGQPQDHDEDRAGPATWLRALRLHPLFCLAATFGEDFRRQQPDGQPD